MELAFILMMILIIVAVGAMKLHEPSLAFPFKKKANLFTPVERSFLELIEKLLPALIPLKKFIPILIALRLHKTYWAARDLSMYGSRRKLCRLLRVSPSN